MQRHYYYAVTEQYATVQGSCRLDQNQVLRKFNGTIGLAL
jgi:hypothetical protein